MEINFNVVANKSWNSNNRNHRCCWCTPIVQNNRDVQLKECQTRSTTHSTCNNSSSPTIDHVDCIWTQCSSAKRNDHSGRKGLAPALECAMGLKKQHKQTKIHDTSKQFVNNNNNSRWHYKTTTCSKRVKDISQGNRWASAISSSVKNFDNNSCTHMRSTHPLTHSSMQWWKRLRRTNLSVKNNSKKK